jgi:hypothetical protein
MAKVLARPARPQVDWCRRLRRGKTRPSRHNDRKLLLPAREAPRERLPRSGWRWWPPYVVPRDASDRSELSTD